MHGGYCRNVWEPIASVGRSMNHKYEILLLIFGGLKSLHNVINSCISSGSFTVTSEGCKVVLACGIRFYFPPGAAPDPLQIYFRSLTPDPQWVKLRHHDVLLSRVLELQPHGVQFQQVRIHPGHLLMNLPLQ